MICAIIQARMSSTRLPGKVFKPLAGKPLLWHVVNRLRPSRFLDQIIIATTTNPADSEITQWCEKEKVLYSRGSESDVLDRYYQCALQYKADTIVRITADDPFKDYQLMDNVIEKMQLEHLDFAYNNKPATYPEGIDIEVFTFAALERAAKEAQDPFEREHMTQYLHRHPELFNSSGLQNKQDLSGLRWTIDTQIDYDMASKVYDHLGLQNFLTSDILSLIEKNPDIGQMNLNVKRSFGYSK